MRRRDLVVAAAGAAVLSRPSAALAQVSREADALTRTLRHEHVSVFAYDAALGSELLRGDEARLARRLRGHEAQHADALAKALGDIGWPQPHPPDRVDQVEVPEIRAAIEAMRDRAGARALLVRTEQLSFDVYRAALARLRDGPHLQLAATILAAEASHLVAWRPVR